MCCVRQRGRSARRCSARHLFIDVDAALWHRGGDVGVDGSNIEPSGRQTFP